MPKSSIDQVSENAKQKLRNLGYDTWLYKQNLNGKYRAESAQYNKSTVAQFLIYYRMKSQKQWDTERDNYDFSPTSSRYKRISDDRLAKHNILKCYLDYNDDDINSFSVNRLESFIDNVYDFRNETFNEVNNKNKKSSDPSQSYISKIRSASSYLYRGGKGVLMFSTAAVAIPTELSGRLALTSLCCLGYGALKIAEKAESTSTFRKGFGNAEFKIQVAKENLETRISSLTSELSTVKYFFGSGGKKQTTQNNSTHSDETNYGKMTLKQKQESDFERYQLELEHQLSKKERPGFYNTSNGGRNGDRPPTHYTGNGGSRPPSHSSRYSGPSHSRGNGDPSHRSRYGGPSHARVNGGR